MNCISFSFLYQKEKQMRARALKIQNENLLNMKMVVNPCLESIIQKIYFLKDENCRLLVFLLAFLSYSHHSRASAHTITYESSTLDL